VKLDVAVIPFNVPLTVTGVATATPFGLNMNLAPRVPAGTITEEGRLPTASFVAIKGIVMAALSVCGVLISPSKLLPPTTLWAPNSSVLGPIGDVTVIVVDTDIPR
jgi:hypothetical protein